MKRTLGSDPYAHRDHASVKVNEAGSKAAIFEGHADGGFRGGRRCKFAFDTLLDERAAVSAADEHWRHGSSLYSASLGSSITAAESTLGGQVALFKRVCLFDTHQMEPTEDIDPATERFKRLILDGPPRRRRR